MLFATDAPACVPAASAPDFGLARRTDLPSDVGEWPGTLWVAEVKGREEKAVAESLVARGVPVYLPLRRIITKYGPQRKMRRVSWTAAFPRFLFFAGDVDARYEVASVRNVFGIITVARQDKLRRELSQFKRLLDDDADLMTENSLPPGKPCYVKAGRLRNTFGKVIGEDKQRRFYIEIELLGQKVPVEVDPRHLELL